MVSNLSDTIYNNCDNLFEYCLERTGVEGATFSDHIKYAGHILFGQVSLACEWRRGMFERVESVWKCMNTTALASEQTTQGVLQNISLIGKGFLSGKESEARCLEWMPENIAHYQKMALIFFGTVAAVGVAVRYFKEDD